MDLNCCCSRPQSRAIPWPPTRRAATTRTLGMERQDQIERGENPATHTVAPATGRTVRAAPRVQLHNQWQHGSGRQQGRGSPERGRARRKSSEGRSLGYAARCGPSIKRAASLRKEIRKPERAAPAARAVSKRYVKMPYQSAMSSISMSSISISSSIDGLDGTPFPYMVRIHSKDITRGR